MSFQLQIPSPLQQVQLPLLNKYGIRLFIKRDDLIHPHVQGNKWRKLKFNLIEARTKRYQTLLTFGGAYSNHIYATAAAAQAFGFNAIGVIRGKKPSVLSATLQFALSAGMQLHFVERAAYGDKASLTDKLREAYGDFCMIPEGGTNLLALKGVEEMMIEMDAEFDYYCAAVGTGGTLAGMIAALRGRGKVTGFSSLKGEDTLTAGINELVRGYTGSRYHNFNINFDYHFGGYARVQPELITFIRQFKKDTGIQLEPVYTGKMLYGLFDLIMKGYFPAGSRVVAIHTGGLQGLAGFSEYFQ